MIQWSQQARRDLVSLRGWLTERNPTAAQAHARRIAEAARRLAEFPGLGRPGRLPNTRELVIPQTPYVLPYSVRDGRVLILAVLHHSQRWPPP